MTKDKEPEQAEQPAESADLSMLEEDLTTFIEGDGDA